MVNVATLILMSVSAALETVQPPATRRQGWGDISGDSRHVMPNQGDAAALVGFFCGRNDKLFVPRVFHLGGNRTSATNEEWPSLVMRNNTGCLIEAEMAVAPVTNGKMRHLQNAIVRLLATAYGVTSLS